MTSKMRTYFRRTIDGLVIIIFLYLAWPWAEAYLPFAWYEETLPDEVIALDQEIDEVLYAIPENFSLLYEHTDPSSEYTFARLSKKNILSDVENYEQNVESIVYITAEDHDGMVYTGSGTILTPDGLILTNNHVVEGMKRVVVTTFEGEHYPVTSVAAVDKDLDIIFLDIDAQHVQPAAVGDSNEPKIGDKTLVIGHPEGFLNTLSLGNISGIRNYTSKAGGVQFQITNPISLGNSGGAVFNAFGELVGVPTWSLEYQDNIVQVQNLNFAVPINEALARLPGTSVFQKQSEKPVMFNIPF